MRAPHGAYGPASHRPGATAVEGASQLSWPGHPWAAQVTRASPLGSPLGSPLLPGLCHPHAHNYASPTSTIVRKVPRGATQVPDRQESISPPSNAGMDFWCCAPRCATERARDADLRLSLRGRMNRFWRPSCCLAWGFAHNSPPRRAIWGGDTCGPHPSALRRRDTLHCY